MSQLAVQTRLQSLPSYLTFQATGVDSTPSSDSLPKRLEPAWEEAYPKLTREQCGHLRHFYNLTTQWDGEWPFMGAQDPGHEWDTAYRYQISEMTYAAGAAHYHRLPAMRTMFKNLIGDLIKKMLHRQVWGYWYLTSQSGIRCDPDLKELRKPWADPVCKENVMVKTSFASYCHSRKMAKLNYGCSILDISY